MASFSLIQTWMYGHGKEKSDGPSNNNSAPSVTVPHPQSPISTTRCDAPSAIMDPGPGAQSTPAADRAGPAVERLPDRRPARPSTNTAPGSRTRPKPRSRQSTSWRSITGAHTTITTGNPGQAPTSPRPRALENNAPHSDDAGRTRTRARWLAARAGRPGHRQDARHMGRATRAPARWLAAQAGRTGRGCDGSPHGRNTSRDGPSAQRGMARARAERPEHPAGRPGRRSRRPRAPDATAATQSTSAPLAPRAAPTP